MWILDKKTGFIRALFWTYTNYSKDLFTFEPEYQRHHSHLPRHAIDK